MKIARLNDSSSAGLVISLLKENGFNPLPLQTAESIVGGGAGNFTSVQVPAEEAEAASKFLAENGYEKDLI